jgi:hypothetical protein
MFKKIATLALAITLALTLVVTASAKSVDLAAEFAALVDGENGTYLQKAGDPPLDFDNGIKVSGRTADWNAIDFIFENLEAGVDYTLSVSFSSADSEGYLIAQADNPWGWLVNSEGSATDTLTLEFTLDNDLLLDGQNRVRLMTTNQTTHDYTITAISITGGSAAPVVTAAPVVAGDTNVASDAQKDGADTGIADVAVASAIALVAAGAVVFSRKRK